MVQIKAAWTAYTRCVQLLKERFLLSIGWTTVVLMCAFPLLMSAQLLITSLAPPRLSSALLALLTGATVSWMLVLFLAGLRKLQMQQALRASIIREIPISAAAFQILQFFFMTLAVLFLERAAGMLRVLALIICVFVLIAFFATSYVYPLLARGTGLLRAIRASASIALKAPLFTLTMLALIWLTGILGAFAFGVGALIALPLVGIFWNACAEAELDGV